MLTPDGLDQASMRSALDELLSREPVPVDPPRGAEDAAAILAALSGG